MFRCVGVCVYPCVDGCTAGRVCTCKCEHEPIMLCRIHFHCYSE